MNTYINKTDTLGVISTLYDSDIEHNKTLDKVHEAIVAMPTADVREVKHGKWIENKKKQTKVGDFVHRYWNCSECGIEICNTLPQFDLSAWHYCPNCGEKLEDEKEKKS